MGRDLIQHSGKERSPTAIRSSNFVRRQAAIKNDPGFVADKKPERQNEQEGTLSSAFHADPAEREF